MSTTVLARSITAIKAQRSVDRTIADVSVVVVEGAGLVAVLAPQTGRSVRLARRTEPSKAAPKVRQ